MTEATDISENPKSQGAWSRWPGALSAVGFVAVQLILEESHALIAEYLLGVAVGLAVAAAILWRKRRRPWFWSMIGLLAGIQIVALLAIGNGGLPAHSGKGLMLLVMVEAAVAMALLYWMAWLFDPHQTPRTPASRTVEIVLYGFVAIVIGLIGFTTLAIRHSVAEDARLLRNVRIERSTASMFDLIKCLDPNGYARDWVEVGGNAAVRRSYDYVQAVQTTITDTSAQRLLAVATLRGRPLSAREKSRLGRCL